ncbi:Aste57867_5084 [Aphanomyces stellatus]|uniref:Aste57867_5084 protein n=1 Tax=Aphanomyces stellatus TaxID=120398 RepID=A0A485KCF0_9STRA|nr:hypothetical protein As57867_005071 [Aphanomyces stellatus]VFT82165.1 Aste57867_5084 [Aphanomyces stellatus]
MARGTEDTAAVRGEDSEAKTSFVVVWTAPFDRASEASSEDAPSDAAREARLLKDRLRKQRSKEKVQCEYEALVNEAHALEGQLACLQARQASATDLAKKIELMRCRRRQLEFAFEKAVLYRSLIKSCTASDAAMLLNPRRDAWMFRPDATPINPDDCRLVMDEQFWKLGAIVHSQLPCAPTDAFNLILDDAGDKISFLELRKFAPIESSTAAAAARRLFDALTRVDVSPLVGAASVSSTWVHPTLCVNALRHADGSTSHHVVLLAAAPPAAIHRDAVVVLLRHLNARENVNSWFVFHDVMTGGCVLRSYTQVVLDAPPQHLSHVYTTFLARSTRSNEFMNHIFHE